MAWQGTDWKRIAFDELDRRILRAQRGESGARERAERLWVSLTMAHLGPPPLPWPIAPIREMYDRYGGKA